MLDACTGNGADFCSGVKVTAALRVRRICAEVGETWVANKPGGLNVRNSDDLETPAARSLFAGRFGEADTWAGLGKADEVAEVTGRCTLPPDGINGGRIGPRVVIR